MKMNITVSLDGAIKALGKLEKRTKAATMIALTKTANHAKRMMVDEFKASFDRPTPTTLKSFFVDPAKKEKLWSRVYLKDQRLAGKNQKSAAEILGHHFEGGQRTRKALENLLMQYGLMSPGELVAPGGAANLDRYGNMSRGQINQILSQLKIIRSGFDNAPTGSRKSKRNVARAGIIFWSHGPTAKKVPVIDKATGFEYGYTGGARNHLPKGAWVRTGTGVRPLLLVIKSASYRRRFDIQRNGQAAVDRYFTTEFDAALAKVKATER
jgi:hypothetical protein